MRLRFMKFEDKDVLQQTLESHFKIGSATVEDVLFFIEENKLPFSGPRKNISGALEHERFLIHKDVIVCRASAPTGAKKFLSAWRNILQAWKVLVYSADWQMYFYFDSNILSAIHVDIIYTSF